MCRNTGWGYYYLSRNRTHEGRNVAAQRPIDIAVTKFYMALGGTFVLYLALWAFIAVHQYDEGLGAPYFNVALTASSVVAVLGIVAFLEYARRRPVGTYHTWGEAMFAAACIFFLLFWIYGVVPHQWLVYADSELGWRKGPPHRGLLRGQPGHHLLGPSVRPPLSGIARCCRSIDLRFGLGRERGRLVRVAEPGQDRPC